MLFCFLNPLKGTVSIFIESIRYLLYRMEKESLYRFGISANKIFDYLFAAKPIIHSVDAYNDPVKDAKAGISVPPENVDAIVEAVLKIASMSIEQRAELCKNGREYVLAHHTYKALVEKYLQLI